jgi:hypothetical protein
MRINKFYEHEKKEITLALKDDDGHIALCAIDETGTTVVTLMTISDFGSIALAGAKSVLINRGYNLEGLTFDKDDALLVINDQEWRRNAD